jgi:hypothetical protein
MPNDARMTVIIAVASKITFLLPLTTTRRRSPRTS